ncbi:MAG: hypothetical protein JNL10_10875 [Verrucomicrobiales bacterium]|nr:hypothetical protein [Verrucomicrobiales bacterium]
MMRSFRWATLAWMLLGWAPGGRLMALPPVIQLNRISPDPGGVDLEWTVGSPELRTFLESRDGVDSGAWVPVPGWEAGFPSLSAFRDQRPPVQTRFYRVRGEPGPVSRGSLLRTLEVATMTRAEIQFFINLAGYPVVAERDVRFLRLVYETVDAYGLRTVASGALALPVGFEGPLPMVSYQHGTSVAREDVPSRLNTEGFLGVLFASSGYVAVLPDYLGLGDSPGFPPFHHADSEATAVVDMLRACRNWCASNGVVLKDRLFLTGYSQGGHATLAALREIESRHADEFRITACAAGGGAYDLSGTTTADALSGRSLPNPYYFVYLLAAYRDVYGLPEYLGLPYSKTVPPLLDGTHDGETLNAILPSDPTLTLAPGVRDEFVSNPNHPFRVALRRNDLLDWTPRSPLRLYQCRNDRDVLPANATVAQASFASRGASVELIDPSPSSDHIGCVEPTLLQIKAWFDALRN